MTQPYRVLILTQQCPYPAMGGGALRVWQAINLLSAWGEVTVFSLFRGQFTPPSDPANITWHHCNLAQVKRTIPDKLRRRLNHWRPSGHPRLDWLYTSESAQQLTALVNAYRPDVVLVAEIWLYRYLPLLERWGCPLILDNHNIEGDDSRYLDEEGHLTINPQILHAIRQVEADFIQRVNQVWLCSRADQDRLVQLYGGFRQRANRAAAQGHLRVVANGVDAAYYQTALSIADEAPTNLSVSQGRAILFLGRFSYNPNAAAARLLIEQIYPLLKSIISTSQLWLVGCDPTAAMQQAATVDPDIVVTGQVADVRPYLMKASVMVVPLLQGSGTRLKLLEAFASRCPVVSTAKGAEGLDVRDGRHLLVRDTVEGMVAAVQQLWVHPQQAQVMAEAAYQQFLEHYAWSAIDPSVQASLQALLPDIRRF